MTVTLTHDWKTTDCPDWCAEDHGGEYAERYHFGFERSVEHVTYGVNSETACIVALARLDVDQPGEVGVSVYTDGRLTPAQARHVAALLMCAADRVDGISSTPELSKVGRP
jgi:hypothetical protein